VLVRNTSYSFSYPQPQNKSYLSFWQYINFMTIYFVMARYSVVACSRRNCVAGSKANANRSDQNLDRLGDACDPLDDSKPNGGVFASDNCPSSPNPNQLIIFTDSWSFHQAIELANQVYNHWTSFQRSQAVDYPEQLRHRAIRWCRHTRLKTVADLLSQPRWFLQQR